MAGGGSYRDALVARLRYLIELRGKSVAQVEKELGRSRGFLGDALRGAKRLPLETVLEVLEVLGVDPGRFFAGAGSASGRWGANGSERRSRGEVAEEPDDPLRRIRANLGRGSLELDEVARALRAVVRLLDEKGYLSRDELGSALTSSGEPGGSSRRS